jgi:hypothetical protein
MGETQLNRQLPDSSSLSEKVPFQKPKPHFLKHDLCLSMLETPLPASPHIQNEIFNSKAGTTVNHWKSPLPTLPMEHPKQQNCLSTSTISPTRKIHELPKPRCDAGEIVVNQRKIILAQPWE